MANRNSELDLYLAKNETTEGTDAVPTSLLNAIELMESFEPDDDFAHKPEAENRVRGPHLHPGDPMLMAGLIINQSRKTWLRGTTGLPSAANRIELDPWFLSAGMSATYDATGGAESVAYTPASSNLGTMTEYFFRDGIRYEYVGCRNNLVIAFEAGQPVGVTVAVSGRVDASGVTDVAVPTDAVFKTTEWPTAADSTEFTLDGFTAGIIRSWEHDIGNVVARRDGVKSLGGVQGWRIARRNPTWKCVLEEPLLGTKDFRILRQNKTPIAIDWLIGGTQYNRIDFGATRAFIRKITPSNDDGLALITLEGTLRGTTPFTLMIR